MKDLDLALDAVVYVKLEVLAGKYQVSVETLVSIFLDSRVGTTCDKQAPELALTA